METQTDEAETSAPDETSDTTESGTGDGSPCEGGAAPGLDGVAAVGEQADELAWLTIVTLGPALTPAVDADAVLWHEAFPHDAINVIAEGDLTLWTYIGGSDYPHHAVLGADGRWEAFDTQTMMDIGGGQSAWVTDGGAVMYASDNYGIVN